MRTFIGKEGVVGSSSRNPQLERIRAAFDTWPLMNNKSIGLEDNYCINKHQQRILKLIL